MLKIRYCSKLRGHEIIYLYRSKNVMKMHPKVVLIMCNMLCFLSKYYWSLYMPFQDNGVKVKNTLQIRLWVMFYDVIGLIAAKLSWVDPTRFVAVHSNTRLLYFTKLSGKSIDCNFLVGTHPVRKHTEHYHMIQIWCLIIRLTLTISHQWFW